eukprot:1184646-Prorocentrum_minimum.AAC.1
MSASCFRCASSDSKWRTDSSSAVVGQRYSYNSGTSSPVRETPTAEELPEAPLLCEVRPTVDVHKLGVRPRGVRVPAVTTDRPTDQLVRYSYKPQHPGSADYVNLYKPTRVPRGERRGEGDVRAHELRRKPRAHVLHGGALRGDQVALEVVVAEALVRHVAPEHVHVARAGHHARRVAEHAATHARREGEHEGPRAGGEVESPHVVQDRLPGPPAGNHLRESGGGQEGIRRGSVRRGFIGQV